MIEIKKYNEVIDRLICNDFCFRLEDNKIIIRSATYREERSSVLGFHYWGNVEEYFYELSKEEIDEIIFDAFKTYNKYVAEHIKKTVKKLCSFLAE